MCSMIYEQPHHHQQQNNLDSTPMMTSSADKTSPSFGPTSAVRQPPPPGKENSLVVGIPAQSSVVQGVESIDDGELRLEVTCGQNQATLYTGRLQLGSKGTCVLFENAWLTPNEFQYVSGRETAKDWKRSIKHHGKSLKVLIAKGILTTSPPARCDCGQCNTNTSPRKSSSGGSDCPIFSTNSAENKNSSADGTNEAWRSGAHHTSGDSGLTATASAFRPPPDVLSPTAAYRSADCAVAEQLASNVACSGGDDAFVARLQIKSTVHHQQLTATVDQTHGSSMSLSSPDSRSKKLSSGGLSNGSQKRTRSPSSESLHDHPPSKHQILDAHDLTAARGDQQSRLAYGSESSSARNHQRQQFSPTADSGSQRRRDQSHSSASNSQCRGNTQSSGFKSPSASAHHNNNNPYQNGGSGSQQQQSTTAQKTSPANGSTASTDPRLSSTDASCVISPLAATPYFPFLAAAAAATTTAAQLPNLNPVCYPNPYMMLPLAAAAAAYQNPSAGQFPSPYSWSSPMTSSASSIVGGQSSAGPSNGPAFDFPWMRGGIGQSTGTSSYSSKLSPAPPSMVGDPYELAKQSSTFGLGSAMQNAYGYRSAGSAAAGFGGLFAAAADGLDAYDNYLRSSFKAANPHLASAAAAGFQQSLFDGQHNSAAAAAAAAAGFGVYPPLFQSPYFGIPSR